MSREFRSVVTALAALALLAVSSTHAAAAGNVTVTFSAGDLLIERNSGGGNESDIIRINPVDGAETPLLTGPGFQGEAAYPLNQTHVGFTTFTSGAFQIFTAGPNGESPTQRTFGSQDAFTPSFPVVHPGVNPGFEIGFAMNGDIYVQNLDGTGMRNITPGTPNSFESNPVFSPRGDLAAFQSFNTSTFDLDVGVVNLDGTGFLLLTSGNATDELQPAWDPTGRMLYVTVSGPGGDDVFQINADGSGLTPVLTGPGNQFLAHPAPDGTGFAYSAAYNDVNGDGTVDASDIEIWRANFGGSLRGAADDVRLTTNTVPDYLTDWGALPDEEAPELKLSGKKKQELGKQVTVKAKCDEACTATAKGTLVVPGSKGSDKLLKATKFKLKKKAKDLAAGQAKTLKLKIPGNAGKAAADALDTGDKVKAKLKVSAADGSGNKDTAKRTITLTD